MTSQEEQAKTIAETARILDTLCQSEYEFPLSDLLKDLSLENELAILRFTRLLGIMVKEPFAEKYPIDPEDTRTGAKYGWKWSPDSLHVTNAKGKWQYDLLREMCGLQFSPRLPKAQTTDALLFSFVQYEGSTENRISMYLLKSVHRHICQDKTNRTLVDAAIKKAGSQYVDLVHPKAIVPMAGMSVCSLITSSVPYGVCFGPLAGGITILLLSIGIDAFCRFMNDSINDLRSEEEREQKGHEKKSLKNKKARKKKRLGKDEEEANGAGQE